MSSPNTRGGPPGDLPPEYAEAYRLGFERAYAGSTTGTAPDGAQADARVGFREASPDDMLATAPRKPWTGPSHRLARDADEKRSTWLVPAILTACALLMLLGAYVLGRAVSDAMSDAGHASQPSGVVIPEHASSASSAQHRAGRHSGGNSGANRHRAGNGAKTAQPPRSVYAGAIRAAAIAGASATCQSAPAVDGAGRRVTYPPSNVYDGDLSTAWRCDGNGIGQKLTLTLPATTRIGQVGLVPGYAKTDPVTGTDRYAQNDRITAVRWIFSGNGGQRSVIQRFSGSPSDRSMRTIRIPPVTARTVTVEILASTPGSMNTVAVSEVSIGATR